MGINKLGSNKKPRATLIFNSESERSILKNALTDLAATRGSSPSSAALGIAIEALAETPQVRGIARSMYTAETPRVLDGLEFIFQDLAATGEKGRDSSSLLDFFLELALELGLRIDTTRDDAYLLKNQWQSVTEILKRNSSNSDFDSALAAREAEQLGSVLDSPYGLQEIASFITLLRESWGMLKEYSCTFRFLCAMTRMAFPARKGVVETADTRLTFFKKADVFYEAGIEVSET